MRRLIWLCPVLALVSAPQPGSAQSLFFFPGEVTLIEQARQMMESEIELVFEDPSEQPEQEQEEAIVTGPDRLHLGAVLFGGPQDWTLWLNGERVTPDRLPERIEAISVAPERVRMTWQDVPRDRRVTVELRPRQSWDLIENAVITRDGLSIGP